MFSPFINGEKTEENNTSKDKTSDDISRFKYAPETSVEVERSFFCLQKYIIRPATVILFENIKQHIIIYKYSATTILFR